MALYVRRPRCDEVRIGRGLPSVSVLTTFVCRGWDFVHPIYRLRGEVHIV